MVRSSSCEPLVILIVGWTAPLAQNDNNYMARFDGLLAEPAIATPSLCTPKKNTRSYQISKWKILDGYLNLGNAEIWLRLKLQLHGILKKKNKKKTGPLPSVPCHLFIHIEVLFVCHVLQGAIALPCQGAEEALELL